ncbi:MAG: sigma-70 family RNA polymerase sigma factor [Phycisphaerae bacterium]|nr:sigma-70 family RNA polymerase sigma factor [Phycisphaerae bacterium]
MEQAEQQLISRSLAGEESACRQLYQGYAGMVAGYFRRSGFDRSLAADLTQETFVRVFGSLGGYDQARGAFGAWLSAIARNVARKYWRRRTATNTFDPELADAMFAIPAEASSTPEQREEMSAVADCVARLDKRLGELIRLRYVRGMTTRGIASEAGMPESTVRSRLGEALDCIARCLQGKGIVQ